MKYDNGIKPVNKIELSESHIKLRVIALIIAVLVVIGSLIFIIVKYTTKDKGWNRIELTDNSINEQYYFDYELGDSPTKEYKEVSNIYETSMTYAYSLFDSYKEYDNVNNVYYINNNPNKEIAIEGLLYNAFKDVKASNSNSIFLGPIVSYYNSLILANDLAYDPYTNEDIQAEIEEYINMINDKNHFELRLLDNNKIYLYTSTDFQKLVDDIGIGIINFNYLKNAFILDYLKEKLNNANFMSGYINSYDGYKVSLGSHIEYSYEIHDEHDKLADLVGTFKNSNKLNVVTFKNTVTSTSDNKLIKILPNGSRRTYYIDENDGLSKESVKYLCGYSTNNKLSDIALNMEKVYISDNFDITKLNNDNKYIWINDKVINYTDDKLKIDTLLDGYTTKLVQ